MSEGPQRLLELGCTRVFATAVDPPDDAVYGPMLGKKVVSETWYWQPPCGEQDRAR